MGKTIEFKPDKNKLILRVEDEDNRKTSFIVPFSTDPDVLTSGVLNMLKGENGEELSVTYEDVKEIHSYLTVYFKCHDEDDVIIIPVNSEMLCCVMGIIGVNDPTQCLISYSYACFKNGSYKTMPAITEHKDFVLPIISGYSSSSCYELTPFPSGIASKYLSILQSSTGIKSSTEGEEAADNKVKAILIPAILPISYFSRTQVLKKASEAWISAQSGNIPKVPLDYVGKFRTFGIVLSISIDLSQGVVFSELADYCRAEHVIPQIDSKREAIRMIRPYYSEKFLICGNFMKYEDAFLLLEETWREMEIDSKGDFRKWKVV